MKKILIGSATALALSLAFSPAQAVPGFNASQYCKDNGDFGFSHGECTSIVTRANNAAEGDDASAFCKAFKLVDPTTFDSLFKNHGQCVKSFH